jgi:hypothetical protein
MSYLEKKKQKYENRIWYIVTFLIFVSFSAGRYIHVEKGRWALFLGLCLGVIGLFCLFFIRKEIKKLAPYEAGDELERQVCATLVDMGFVCQRNIETENGDLDVLAQKGNVCFGIEVKDWSGKIEHRDDRLILRDIFDKSFLIGRLKRTCNIVRDRKFKKDSNIFIRPVFIFGYKSSLGVQKIIRIDNVDVVFLHKNNMKQFFSTI